VAVPSMEGLGVNSQMLKVSAAHGSEVGVRESNGAIALNEKEPEKSTGGERVIS